MGGSDANSSPARREREAFSVTGDWLRSVGFEEHQAYDKRWLKWSGKIRIHHVGSEGLAVSIDIDHHVTIATVDKFGSTRYLREGNDINRECVLHFMAALGVAGQKAGE